MFYVDLCFVSLAVILTCFAIFQVRRENAELQRRISRLDRIVEGIRNPILVPVNKVSREEFRQMYPAVKDNPSIKCPQCDFVSYNTNDIKHKFCGKCSEWHEFMQKDKVDV